MDALRLDDLDDDQRIAVLADPTPLMVVAGAGSGKTRTLAHRAAHFVLDLGAPASSVLLTTFTNAAAQEMADRVSAMLGADGREMRVTTIHALCSSILRRHGARRFGRDRAYTIYGERAQQRAVATAWVESGLGEKLGKRDAADFVRRVSYAKEGGYGPGEVPESLAGIYGAYDARLERNNAVDFCDLQGLAIRLLEEDPEVLALLRDRYRYVLVDEWQDVTPVQERFVRLLCAEHRRLTVVGDPSQSIYGFRCADIGHTLGFLDRWPDGRVVTLGTNYRSTGEIVGRSARVVAVNRSRWPLEYRTPNPRGDPVSVILSWSVSAQGRDLGDALAAERERGVSWREMAVLCRSRRSLRLCEAGCRGRDVPYRLVGTASFWEREEVQGLLSWIGLILNPRDEDAFRQAFVFVAPDVGPKTIDAVVRAAAARGCDFMQAARGGRSIRGIGSARAASLAKFADVFDQAAPLRGSAKFVDRLVELLLEGSSVLSGGALRDDPDFDLGVVSEFVFAWHEFLERGVTSAEDFLDWIVAGYVGRDAGEDEDVVSIMTVHAAKGAEFDVVAVVDCQEGDFPAAWALKPTGLPNDGRSPLDLEEEERRVWYVAITRARKRLYLIRSALRRTFGPSTPEPADPSRFLVEMGFLKG